MLNSSISIIKKEKNLWDFSSQISVLITWLSSTTIRLKEEGTTPSDSLFEDLGSDGLNFDDRYTSPDIC